MTFLRRAVTQTLRAPVRASVAPRVAMRSMASTPLRFSEHHQPLIQGEGSKAGELASDEEQSTGLERFELMGLHQGVDVFNMKPLEATRLGTVADPIKVETMVCISALTPGPRAGDRLHWLPG